MGMRTIIGLALILSLFGGCQSAPKKQVDQQIIPDDHEKRLSEKLTQNLDAAFGVWNEPDVQRILNELLARLVAADKAYPKELKTAHVHLLSTATPYIAAGLTDTVYVSRGFLGTVFYENELAFELATQLSLLRDKVTSRTLANLQGQEVGETLITLPTAPPALQRDFLEKGWFEPGGLFDFGNDAYLKAERDGIQLAYGAKFDPRGAVMLIQRWSTMPAEKEVRQLGKILPDPEDRLNSARDEVAKLSPLRDPIVKSRAFEELQARLHVKKAKLKKKS